VRRRETTCNKEMPMALGPVLNCHSINYGDLEIDLAADRDRQRREHQ
jgi:hypothetical protein